MTYFGIRTGRLCMRRKRTQLPAMCKPNRETKMATTEKGIEPGPLTRTEHISICAWQSHALFSPSPNRIPAPTSNLIRRESQSNRIRKVHRTSSESTFVEFDNFNRIFHSVGRPIRVRRRLCVSIRETTSICRSIRMPSAGASPV